MCVMTILYTNNADDCTLLLYLNPFAGVIKIGHVS
jgi:hypothetical protein